MPYRKTSFINGGFYHSFNRGVNKQDIFSNERDYERLIQTIYYYQFSGPKPRFSTHKRFRVKDFNKNSKIVDIICYCLMPNHFHILVRQNKNKGVQEFIGKLSNSYTKYYNTKHGRSGPLLQGEFKAVTIESDEQLLHVSRYIHLNPYVSDLVTNLKDFPYSSYHEFTDLTNDGICEKHIILDFFKKADGYKNFIKDHQDYAKQIEQIKHLIIDEH